MENNHRPALCTKSTVKREGLNIWIDGTADGQEARLDIILVQGLAADPYYTWRGGDRQAVNNLSTSHKSLRDRFKSIHISRKTTPKLVEESSEVKPDFFWPRDLLPQHTPPARIATYSYESSWRSRSFKTTLRECGEQLLNVLCQHRRDEPNRPLIFIGHSLGGLVVQTALVVATSGKTFADLRNSMAGAVFLGTPHQGSDHAAILEWLTKACGNDQPLLETLKAGSRDLFYLSRDFWSEYERLPMMCFYERKDSKYGPLRAKTVTLNSATMTGERMMYLNTDHSGLNKFRGGEDENFGPFIREIETLVTYAVARKHEVNVHGRSKMVMPFPKDPDFTGRENIITLIGDKLTHLETSPRVALFGPGGVGKSQIAIEFAHRMRKRRPEVSIFWVYASNPSRFRSSYLAIATDLGLSETNNVKNHLELVYDWLQSEQSGQWLMIVDNADDVTFVHPHHNSKLPEQHEFTMRQYLPQRAGGIMVITTRNRDAAIGLVNKPTQVLEIEPMGDTDALLLLRTKMLGSHSNKDDERELLLELGSIPLAISQAAAYLSRQRRTTISAYLALLRQDETSGASLLSVEEGNLWRDPEVSNSVIRTWEISFDAIKTQNATAAEVLSCLCMFDKQNIPEFLVKGDFDTITFDNAIELLLAFSIIRMGPNETFEMHRLVQLATRTWLHVHKQFDTYSHIAIHTLKVNLPRDPYETWHTYQLLEPHVESVLANDRCTREDRLLRASILYKRARYFYLRDELTMAEEYALESQAIREELCTGERSQTIMDNLQLLAFIYRQQGRFLEAKDLTSKVVDAMIGLYGEDSREMITALFTLAEVYIGENNGEEAVRLATSLASKTRSIFGPDDSSTLYVTRELADVLFTLERYEEARTLLEQVVDGFGKTSGGEPCEILSAMGMLAYIHNELGQSKEFERISIELVERGKRAYGEKHPRTIEYMYVLAKAQFANDGRTSVAVATLSQALQLARDNNYFNENQIREWETQLHELGNLARAAESMARDEPS